MSETTDLLRQHAIELFEAGILDVPEIKFVPVWQAAELIDHLEAQLFRYLSGEEVVCPHNEMHANRMIAAGRSFLSQNKAES